MRRTAAAIAALTVGLAGIAVAGGSAAAATDRDPVPWTQPSWVSAAAAVGGADPSATATVRVMLRWRDLAGAHATASAVSDPTNAQYHRYLSAAQVRARFGPTPAAEQRVVAWLAGAGLHIGDIPANALYVPATGTVTQLQRAFSTSIASYRYRGRSVHAATAAPSAPVGVGAEVVGVSGLDSVVTQRTPGIAHDRDRAAAPQPRHALAGAAVPTVAPPSTGFRTPGPCSKYWGQKLDGIDPRFTGVPNPMPYVPCGYQPAQLRSAYGIDHAIANGNDGRGVRVAVVDAYASPTAKSDLKTYTRKFDPTHVLTGSQYSERVFPETDPSLEAPDQCDASGWYGEETLDLEAVHTMAPGAAILYVGAASCLDDDINAALNDVVDHHRADIVTNSYGNSGEVGIPAAELAAFDTITTQAALEGIGLYFSSGDDGDEAAVLGHPAADYSATSPQVTAVGGTSLGVDATGHTVLERGWETGIASLTGTRFRPAYPGDFLYGSGGGTSMLYREPDYQRAVVPDALAKIGKRRGRVVPDIAILGDPNTGMLVGQTQQFSDGVYFDTYRIGGTSLSSPLFAGVMALADQRSGYAHGFANPALYRLYRSGAFTDVTPGAPVATVRVNFVNGQNAVDGTSTSARIIDFPHLSIHTAVGYDRVTGMGTPWGPTFLLLMGAR